ncbi:MAG TPA: sigma-70 family RNA polymerase sigma factor [Fimbriiglobus sp.]|nr:sigma-70 family RNA polymerase sigma factor [Fimbriiglobus sp.]
MDATSPLLRAAARSAAADDPPDDRLLDRYVAGRDEAAFTLLVTRHGPMVLGVCRRVLGPGPDADDAFQATFLVLVRRAAAVRHRDRLAGWLYGVAHRTALEARSLRAKHRRREVPTNPLPDVPARPTESPEFGPLVERELARLSEKYRAAVALCDVDGRPRAEAARLLGVPEGTLSSRLAAGRKILARRLARYGLPTVAIGTVGVDGNLLAATVAAVAGVGNCRVQDIASGVTNAMLYAKLRVWAAVPVLAGLAALPFGGWGGAKAVPPVAVALSQASTVPATAVQDNKDVADAPPVVVKTVPEAGTTDVDPGIKEIKVTFSKEMMDKSWSWATDLRYGKAIEPADKVHYVEDKKTCVMPCKLEPGTTYAVWINSEKFTNFHDTDGRPAVPYLLVFQTKKK